MSDAMAGDSGASAPAVTCRESNANLDELIDRTDAPDINECVECHVEALKSSGVWKELSEPQKELIESSHAVVLEYLAFGKRMGLERAINLNLLKAEQVKNADCTFVTEIRSGFLFGLIGRMTHSKKIEIKLLLSV